MSTEVGLRERKKQQTRRRIAQTALRLFAERGFDRVPVSEVARGAEVSEATVFNYFPTKEDLVYDGFDDFAAATLDAIRQRPAGQSIVDAFGEFVVRPHSLATNPDTVAFIATAARIIADSATLRARERLVHDNHTRDLADLIAAETGAGAQDVEPWVVANALMGVNRALKDFVHRQALGGHSGRRIAKDAVEQGNRALAALEHGLSDYRRASMP